jgi:thiol-disulfide isomerase/thioredoxin
MKKSLSILAFLILITSCKKDNNLDDFDGFIVEGKSYPTNDVFVYLQTQNNDKSFTTIDSVITKKHYFLFKGHYKNPELLFLSFPNIEDKLPIVASNSRTTISINKYQILDSKISGSDLQNSYTNYQKNLIASKNKFVYQLKYIKAHPNSIVSTMVLKQMLGKTKWRLNQNQKAYNYLSEAMKNSHLGIRIHNFILENTPLVKNEIEFVENSLNPNIADETPVIKAVEEVVKPEIKQPKIYSNNKKVPNFSAESMTGNDISLNTIRKGAKVTLIDFWASWCGPCRTQNPDLVKLYNKYHSKGFNIVSVSEDKYSDKKAWLNAIQNDNLQWHQIIDDNNRVAKMFGVKVLPHTVLLDANGSIIFQKKSSYTIEQKLKEIFR